MTTDTTDTVDLSICVDCLCFHANGDAPNELNEEETSAWIESLTDLRVIVTDGDYGFCVASKCDSCGSTLGGDRFKAVAFIEPNTNDN